jgi:DNA-binding transcriptional ArsR family regulator
MYGSVPVVPQERFVYDQSMDVEFSAEEAVSRIAAAIGEPARARILYSLLDGHARTSTELALVAEVSPSTASVHLAHLKDRGLVRVLAQGKHRYYSLDGPHTAAALEALMVVAVGPDNHFVPNTPQRLRAARTCYDHMAGTIAVTLHDRFEKLGWLTTTPSYEVTMEGSRALAALGIDIDSTRALRRRFAYGCVDWSERKPHIGGALGAALLSLALERRWVSQDLDSRALRVSRNGRRQLLLHFGVRL